MEELFTYKTYEIEELFIFIALFVRLEADKRLQKGRESGDAFVISPATVVAALTFHVLYTLSHSPILLISLSLKRNNASN